MAGLSHQRVNFWAALKDSCVYTTLPYWCDRNPNPMQTFGYVANRLNSFGLAYLQHIIDGTVVPTTYLRNRFTGGSLIAPP